MTSTIQTRVDDDLKVKSDFLFKNFGTDTPFEIRRRTAESNVYAAMTESKLLERLENSRTHVVDGNVRDADDVRKYNDYIEYIL